MIAFTYHDIQSDRTGTTPVPIFLDSTREEKILTIFRLVSLIVFNFGTCHTIDSRLIDGIFINDKIILQASKSGEFKADFRGQSIKIYAHSNEIIFEARYVVSKHLVSSPTLYICKNHLDPLFDDNVPADLPDHYSGITRGLYGLWRHLLETHPAAHTPAYDYTPALIPSEFF